MVVYWSKLSRYHSTRIFLKLHFNRLKNSLLKFHYWLLYDNNSELNLYKVLVSWTADVLIEGLLITIALSMIGVKEFNYKSIIGLGILLWFGRRYSKILLVREK